MTIDITTHMNADRIRTIIDKDARQAVSEGFSEFLSELSKGETNLNITLKAVMRGSKLVVSPKAVVQRTIKYSHDLIQSEEDLAQTTLRFGENEE